MKTDKLTVKLTIRINKDMEAEIKAAWRKQTAGQSDSLAAGSRWLIKKGLEAAGGS